MQSISSRIWTRVAVSLSYDDNHYTTDTQSIAWPKEFEDKLWNLYKFQIYSQQTKDITSVSRKFTRLVSAELTGTSVLTTFSCLISSDIPGTSVLLSFTRSMSLTWLAQCVCQFHPNLLIPLCHSTSFVLFHPDTSGTYSFLIPRI